MNSQGPTLCPTSPHAFANNVFGMSPFHFQEEISETIISISRQRASTTIPCEFAIPREFAIPANNKRRCQSLEPHESTQIKKMRTAPPVTGIVVIATKPKTKNSPPRSPPRSPRGRKFRPRILSNASDSSFEPPTSGEENIDITGLRRSKDTISMLTEQDTVQISTSGKESRLSIFEHLGTCNTLLKQTFESRSNINPIIRLPDGTYQKLGDHTGVSFTHNQIYQDGTKQNVIHGWNIAQTNSQVPSVALNIFVLDIKRGLFVFEYGKMKPYIVQKTQQYCIEHGMCDLSTPTYEFVIKCLLWSFRLLRFGYWKRAKGVVFNHITYLLQEIHALCVAFLDYGIQIQDNDESIISRNKFRDHQVQQQMKVVIPPSSFPGSIIQSKDPNGRLVSIQIPQGALTGTTIQTTEIIPSLISLETCGLCIYSQSPNDGTNLATIIPIDGTRIRTEDINLKWYYRHGVFTYLEHKFGIQFEQSLIKSGFLVQASSDQDLSHCIQINNINYKLSETDMVKLLNDMKVENSAYHLVLSDLWNNPRKQHKKLYTIWLKKKKWEEFKNTTIGRIRNTFKLFLDMDMFGGKTNENNLYILHYEIDGQTIILVNTHFPIKRHFGNFDLASKKVTLDKIVTEFDNLLEEKDIKEKLEKIKKLLKGNTNHKVIKLMKCIYILIVRQKIQDLIDHQLKTSDKDIFVVLGADVNFDTRIGKPDEDLYKCLLDGTIPIQFIQLFKSVLICKANKESIFTKIKLTDSSSPNHTHDSKQRLDLLLTLVIKR